MFPTLALIGSSQDLLVILIVIFLLFGAAKVPEVARSLGRARGEFEIGKREVEEEIRKRDEPKDSPSEDERTRRAARELGIEVEGKSLADVKKAIADKLR